jgi:pimeloyl-ACP methyl ester carboxylesterase
MLRVILLLLVCTKVLAYEKDTLGIEFSSEGYMLSGQIICPKEKNKKIPAIIFAAGSGENSSFLSAYKGFLNHLIETPLKNDTLAFVYFDKRGIGKSEGKWYKTDFYERATDVKNAAEYLKTLPYIDPEKIYVAGHSQGGWIVQLCLSGYSNIFAGGISMAGATFGVKKQLINDYYSSILCSGKESDPAKIYRKAERKVNSILAITTLFPIQDNWKQLKTIRKFEIRQSIPKITKPILYLWGEEDRLVYPQWCIDEIETIFPDGLPSNFSTYTIPEASHSFRKIKLCEHDDYKTNRYIAETGEHIKEWLHKHIR